MEDINFDLMHTKLFCLENSQLNVGGFFSSLDDTTTARKKNRRVKTRKNSAMHKINKFQMTHKLFIFCCHTSIFHCCTSPCCCHCLGFETDSFSVLPCCHRASKLHITSLSLSLFFLWILSSFPSFFLPFDSIFLLQHQLGVKCYGKKI